MENNMVFFATLKNIRPITGADKIVLATVTLDNIPVTNVVVGVGTVEGQQIVYFDSNMCVGLKVTEAHPELATYLAKNNRVKAVRFNKFGVVSNGLAVEFDKFLQFDKKLIFKEGESFLSINGTEIAKKYIPPNIKVSEPGQKKKKVKSVIQIVPGQFNFHIDTKQLLRNINQLGPKDTVSLSEKWHGCVSEDTLIETLEHGTLKIKEIVDSKVNCKIKALDINSQEIVYVPIDDYYLLKDDGDWYEIELENGQKIEITSNNPVWLPELHCYREVKDLDIGDILLFDN